MFCERLTDKNTNYNCMRLTNVLKAVTAGCYRQWLVVIFMKTLAAATRQSDSVMDM